MTDHSNIEDLLPDTDVAAVMEDGKWLYENYLGDPDYEPAGLLANVCRLIAVCSYQQLYINDLEDRIERLEEIVQP